MQREIDAAKERVERALRASAGAIAAQAFSEFRMERNGVDLVIRVKLDGFSQ